MQENNMIEGRHGETQQRSRERGAKAVRERRRTRAHRRAESRHRRHRVLDTVMQRRATGEGREEGKDGDGGPCIQSPAHARPTPASIGHRRRHHVGSFVYISRSLRISATVCTPVRETGEEEGRREGWSGTHTHTHTRNHTLTHVSSKRHRDRPAHWGWHRPPRQHPRCRSRPPASRME